MSRDLATVLDTYARLVRLGEKQALRTLLLKDLFALLVVGMRRADMRHQWLLERCDEVQAEPNGYLDLWAREHGKTSIISIGLTIQGILNDPEVTIGVFSFNRPMAKGILRAVKREFEANELLRDLFPDILWTNPRKEAPKWSEDDGIIVKRKGNPKESTLEAWGLVDGQPIGKHFGGRMYDDIVTAENAANPEMREKTLRALELSYNLGTRGGWQRFAGTRYHYSDAYAEIMKRGTATPRIYSAVDAGRRPLAGRWHTGRGRDCAHRRAGSGLLGQWVCLRSGRSAGSRQP